MPYVMVLPIKGTQWKTSGGSFGLRLRSWRKTFTRMAEMMVVANARRMICHVLALESKTCIGLEILLRSPIVDGSAIEKDVR